MSESAKKLSFLTEFDVLLENDSILTSKEIKTINEIVEDIMDEYVSILLRGSDD